MSTQQILDLELPENDSGERTVRGYLAALARVAWDEKRPFGNSGWHYDLYGPLVRAGLVEGTIDEDGDLTSFDDDAAEDLIFSAMRALGLPATTVTRPTRNDRHDALVQAVVYHAEVGVDEHEHVVRTAAEMAAFLADGTVPASAGDVPAIVIVRNDEQIEVHIDGEVVASTTYDQSGHAGMDAVEQAALRVARALDYEPEETRP